MQLNYSRGPRPTQTRSRGAPRPRAHPGAARTAPPPSAEAYRLVWQSKPLTRRDLTIPNAEGTHQTGSISLDKGLLAPDVDHRHYFRDEVFAHLDWEHKSATVDQAVATFQIVLKGRDYGDFLLPIRHTTSTTTRSYEQRNAMTRLSWGEARRHVADGALIGRTLSLSQDLHDPTRFVISID